MAAGTSRPSRRKRIASWVFQVVLFVLLAANIEMYCYRHLQSEGYETPDGLAEADAVTLWRLKPGVWKAGNHPLYVNRDGIRNPEITGPPGPRVLRVMMLGGSVTYGSGLGDSETFARRLEVLLQARVSAGWTVQVVNAGIPGHNSYQCLSLFEELAPTYQPQIVIPTWGFNDGVPSTAQGYRAQHAHGSWRVERVLGWVRGWMTRSATYRYMGRKLLGRPRLHAAEEDVDDMADNLRYLDESASANGARVLFVFEAARPYDSLVRLSKAFNCIDPIYLESRRPDRVARLHEAYEKVVQERGIPEVDMHARLLAYGEDKAFHPGDICHPGPEGAAVIAQVLADKLQALGWLP